MFCSAMPTLIRQSGNRFRNSFRLEEPIESFDHDHDSRILLGQVDEASQRTPRGNPKRLFTRVSSLDLRCFDLCERGRQLNGIRRHAMMPLDPVFHERHALGLCGCGRSRKSVDPVRAACAWSTSRSSTTS